jgi:hypothetical protein
MTESDARGGSAKDSESRGRDGIASAREGLPRRLPKRCRSRPPARLVNRLMAEPTAADNRTYGPRGGEAYSPTVQAGLFPAHPPAFSVVGLTGLEPATSAHTIWTGTGLPNSPNRRGTALCHLSYNPRCLYGNCTNLRCVRQSLSCSVLPVNRGFLAITGSTSDKRPAAFSYDRYSGRQSLCWHLGQDIRRLLTNQVILELLLVFTHFSPRVLKNAISS